jgi:aryl-alcohol dehydrogenase-like predicted oxidoreductase
MLQRRPLGASGIDVSVLSLGSWRTYEHIPRERGLAVMKAAQECGIAFLDDARYNDESGKAPLPTGYSEVVFGELFRAAGWRRDEVVVANKLWWEFWPAESAAQELDSSLTRMGFDYVDLIYATEPPQGLGAAEIVDSLAGLISSGKARAWGILNWPPDLLVEAVQAAHAGGVPPPCAAQLPYSVFSPSFVEGAEESAALADSNVSVVASAVLLGGALTGKYADPDATGRHAGRVRDPGFQETHEVAAVLVDIAERFSSTPAALAIAFALAGPRVASVLFGATRPEQVHENVRAIDVDPAALGELRRISADRVRANPESRRDV